jgi:PKD repeat protein
LTATRDIEATDSISQTVTVTDNEAPTASFTYAPTSPEAGETVTFNASNSSDSDGTIQSYEWDFDGDGTTDDIGETVTWSPSAGTYDVTLTVTDNEDGVSTITRTIQVSGLAYGYDLGATGSGDVLTFSMTNYWPASTDDADEIMITQLFVDPADNRVDTHRDRDCGTEHSQPKQDCLTRRGSQQ